MRKYIDGNEFVEMFLCAADALESNKQQINELNVFPVPDGDTGTNMSLTMNAAAVELKKKRPAAADAAADCAAAALLRGARGNSGVILSLLFRGLSKSLKGKSRAGAADFAAAMTNGVDAAYKAVMKPTEGTILTVSRMAAEAAVEFAKTSPDIELMLVCALEAARDALAETINQNPVLKKAGVIDAGGQGYVLIIDAMLGWMQGRVAASVGIAEPEPKDKADFSMFDTEDILFGYCTEFIVGKENDKPVMLLRAFLESIGDSVVVVDDDEIIKTHVHSNEPGRIITEALTYGSLISVKIENMRQQHTELGNQGASEPEAEPDVPAAPEKKYGVVTICAGKGVEALFRELGADRVVSGGQTMNPSTQDILYEIERTPAEVVFVFPNNKNIIMAAEQCIPLSEKKVVVIPTTTVPQGVSAMLNLDTYADERELVDSFNESAQAVHTALVTYAVRDSDFDGHSICAGEYLGLVDGALLGSFTDKTALMTEIGEALEQFNPDIISLYYGENVSVESAEGAAKIIEERFSNADVHVIDGGQPVYHFMISAE